MTDIGQELAYWKKEVEIMHKMGKLVPSSTYEKIHRLEKKVKQEKQNESNISG